MQQDKIRRRSRFKRSPTGKRIALTERDNEIFRLLFRYRYLRATTLAAFIRPKSQKRFIERLGDLYHETDLVDRPAAQWRRFDARYQPIIYELSLKGLHHLESLGSSPERAVSFTRRDRKGTTPQFDHAMMIVHALAETELKTIETDGQRFVPMSEILSRAPQTTQAAKKPLSISVTIKPNKHLPNLKTAITTELVPDALYGIEYLIDGEKRYRFYALECENQSPRRRSTTKLSSLALKQAAYEALIQNKKYKEVWGIPNLKLRVVGK